jgi:murein DD-endopeptidase MepM/ murein hydrolase activator NlpD
MKIGKDGKLFLNAVLQVILIESIIWGGVQANENHNSAGTVAHQVPVTSGPLPQPVPQIVPKPAQPATIPSPSNAESARPLLTNNHLLYELRDEKNGKVVPLSVVRANDELFYLGSDCLWYCAGAKPLAGAPDILVLKRIDPPALINNGLKAGPAGTPWQEFNDCVYMPSRMSIIILDKSGDLFEYNVPKQTWGVFRANGPTQGSPDPDYISLCVAGDTIVVLDPERNEIWRINSHGKASRGFREVMPWRARAGDPFVGDGLAIACDREFYVLKKHGQIVKFAGTGEGISPESHLAYKQPHRMRPTRLILAGDDVKTAYIYVVERENNRVTRIDRHSGASVAFLFPANSNLRNLISTLDGFWILDGDNFVFRTFKQAVSADAPFKPRPLDPRLRGFIFPIAGQGLPAHPGVFPGARRLYRFGVHEGLDLFSGGGKTVVIGTQARAVKKGSVLRADANFVDMNARKFNQVMEECRHDHRTSDKNEDLLRGCQVWIDHGSGLVTRYAHLNKTNTDLKLNEQISRGSLIGYVGVSGTGQNLPGKAQYPHLHFEIRLDGKYLGYGLTPQETMWVYEDIFANENEK